MPVEIEAKMKAPDLDAIRARLRAASATRVGSRLELNAFFDSPDKALKAKDEGLRLRTMTDERGDVTCVATFKGPQAHAADDDLKRREEIEFSVGDFELASAMFARLGYPPALAFEKRRETWSLDGCLVELDELPHLGTFVEIEGESPDRIHTVRRVLGLADEPLITRGYIGMMSRLVRDDPSLGSIVRFGGR